ncbi:hypothetical protein C8R45DRAFT_901493 [Mycena sanguinolenta]|nr:hypothetical protein C8R45DRAFT_901493 [Mycena sanguinolenta]
MDSQLTLVNASPPVCLTFSTNSMINATLYRDSRPVYTIATELQGTTTEIRAWGTSQLLVRIARKELLPSTITFPNINGGKDMRLGKWLRRCKVPDGGHAYVIQTEVGNCILKKHQIYRLALFTEYDLETPVAHWENATGTPSLILHSGTENFYPQIIAAFTVRELKMRMAEKADIMAQSRAAAQSKTLVSLNQ